MTQARRKQFLIVPAMIFGGMGLIIPIVPTGNNQVIKPRGIKLKSGRPNRTRRRLRRPCTQQTWDVGPTLAYCWPTVYDVGSTVNRRSARFWGEPGCPRLPNLLQGSLLAAWLYLCNSLDFVKILLFNTGQFISGTQIKWWAPYIF